MMTMRECAAELGIKLRRVATWRQRGDIAPKGRRKTARGNNWELLFDLEDVRARLLRKPTSKHAKRIPDKPWQEWEEKYLETARIRGVSAADAARHLNRTPESIYGKCRVMGYEYFDGRVLRYLSHLKEGHTLDGVALALGVGLRAVAAIKTKLRKRKYEIPKATRAKWGSRKKGRADVAHPAEPTNTQSVGGSSCPVRECPSP